LTRTEFKQVENFMLDKMKDAAHDQFHIYRVLYTALKIANAEKDVDLDVLITSCLLHDIGREYQSENQGSCHAKVGSEMAFKYLIERGWDLSRATHVKNCINSHRFRGNNPPESIEAKILFDADKLDVTGAIGISRTLIYAGQISEPLYALEDNNVILDGGGGECSSFFQEYNYKLKDLHDSIYTDHARQIALERNRISTDFYNSLLNEVVENHSQGVEELEKIFND